MAKMYKTANLLQNYKRNTNYSNDVKVDNSVEVETVQTKLLAAIDRMMEDNIPLTQTRLQKETGVAGSSLKRYNYIFKDMIEMLNFFKLGKRDKMPDELKKIPLFDTLESDTMRKTHAYIMGEFDELGATLFDINKIDKDLVDNKFLDIYYEVAYSQTAFLEGNVRIHPDFADLNINEIFDLIEKKYNQVQDLQKVYNEIKNKLDELQ